MRAGSLPASPKPWRPAPRATCERRSRVRTPMRSWPSARPSVWPRSSTQIPDIPLRQLTEVLTQLERVGFASAQGAEAAVLAERARALARELAP